MDDVDAVQAQIARNMLDSGDWVTARLNGVAYLEKSPLVYWLMAVSFAVFGVHDWAARLPIALSVSRLAWLTIESDVGLSMPAPDSTPGLCIATCIGLFLFTRILIPDVILTTTIALAMWAFLRALDEHEPRPRLWAYTFWAAIAHGTPAERPDRGCVSHCRRRACIFFSQSSSGNSRGSVRLGLAILLVIAAPWHILATLRNPPYFDLTPKSEPGHYHGFFWFYFLNEHVFRFLNMRHPRDYNTVPRYLFWLFHLLWLFPWSAFFPGLLKLSYKPVDRGGPDATARALLGGFRDGVLHFFHDARILFDADLPCACAVARLRDGDTASMATVGARKSSLSLPALAALAIVAILWHVQWPADSGRYLQRAHLEPRSVHAFSRPHGRPHARSRSPIYDCP